MAKRVKKCSKSKYRSLFKKYIKSHPFKTAVRMAWKGACRVR